MRLPSPARPVGKLDLLIWALPALGLAIIGALWWMVLQTLDGERALVEREIEQRGNGLNQAFSEHTRRSLQQIDQITAFVASDLEHGLGRSSERAAAEAGLARLLRLGLDDLPGVRSLYIADAQGRLLSSSRPAEPGEIAGKPHFLVHREGQRRGLHIGRPEQNAGDPSWRLHLTRRLQHADGGFAGVVGVVMDPYYFTDFYRASQFGDQGVVGLLGLDWVLRARRSGERVWFGEVSGTRTLIHQLARWPQGSYLATSRLDGVHRRMAYQTLEDYQMVVFTGLSLPEALVPYQARRAAALRATGIASLTLMLAFGGLSFAAITLRRSQASRERARAQFEAASNASLDAFWILRAERAADGRLLDFRFTHCNDRGAELLRRPKEQILWHTRAEVFKTARDPRFFEMYARVLESGRPLRAEFVIETPPAAGLVLQHQVVPVGDGVAITSRDVTAERRREQAMLDTQEALRAAEKRLHDITDHLPVLIGYLDAQERLLFVNATFKDWLGIEPGTALGRPLREVIGETLYAQRAPWLHRALAGEAVSFELQSETLGVSRSLKNEYLPDIAASGVVQGLYTLSQDVSALKSVQRELQLLARHDSLTGLPNRHHFDELLGQALRRAQRSGSALALLFLDIDRFKSINDSLGHAMGDAVLQEFARRLQRSVRSTDTVARLAGDEFVIILEGLGGEAEPAAVAAKIVAAMGPRFELQGQQLQVSTSIGLAQHQGGAITPAELLARADEALYQAKKAGRNTYRVAGV